MAQLPIGQWLVVGGPTLLYFAYQAHSRSYEPYSLFLTEMAVERRVAGEMVKQEDVETRIDDVFGTSPLDMAVFGVCC